MPLSLPVILEKTAEIFLAHEPKIVGPVLDVGSGQGDLLVMLKQQRDITPFACDYTNTWLRQPDIPLALVNLNAEPLPYPDRHFNAVVCTEVIEHLEHYRATLREAFRVLRPGGIALVSTPNILNLRSRLSFLLSGFWNLFGPLRAGETRLESSDAHINPVSVFYLAHAMADAGFINLELHIDKIQRRSVPLFCLVYPLIYLASRAQESRECRKYRTVDELNRPWLRWMRSPKVMLGRTIILKGSRSSDCPESVF
jgi:ubiquinone/menaquinone biosynthesis C-methylase UbiE